MPSPPPRAGGVLSQRAIYDVRYSTEGYDTRSAVRVLRAERRALHAAAARAVALDPGVGAVSLLDFGYGTGRVTNEFVLSYPRTLGRHRRDLHVVAFDVSGVGLRKGARELAGLGFSGLADLRFHQPPDEVYLAGSMTRMVDGLQLTVTFAHAHECAAAGCAHDQDEQVARSVRKALGRDHTLLTTSWYSGIGHVAGRERRTAVFRTLGRVTAPAGELLLTVSATGDLSENQAAWLDLLRRGQTGGYPVEEPGDVVYETELGQTNFWHVFGKDLEDAMRATRTADQPCWIQAVRMPDEEFRTPRDERENYRRVRRFNSRLDGREWTCDDYRQVHTVLGIRSGAGPRPPGTSVIG